MAVSTDDIGPHLTMSSISPFLLLVLASAFVLFGPRVEAIRVEPSLEHVTDSKIVVFFDLVDNTPSDSRFKKEIGPDHARKVLNEADYFVLGLLNEIPIQRGYLGGTVTVESFAGCGDGDVTGPLKVSATTGNHIRVNSDYIDKFNGDVRAEFDGIVYHEMTKVWLWNGQGTAPKWLVSGIADYARLKSGHPSKEWTWRRSGSAWTEGYAVTAYFFEYLGNIRKGFVADLNAMMKTGYSDEYFVKLFGKSVKELWKDYMGTYLTNVSPMPAPAPAPFAKQAS